MGAYMHLSVYAIKVKWNVLDLSTGPRQTWVRTFLSLRLSCLLSKWIHPPDDILTLQNKVEYLTQEMVKLEDKCEDWSQGRAARISCHQCPGGGLNLGVHPEYVSKLLMETFVLWRNCWSREPTWSSFYLFIFNILMNFAFCINRTKQTQHISCQITKE